MTVRDILDSTVTVDDAGVTQRLRGGEVIRVAWDDLVEFSVVTTDYGPVVEDVYFDLLGRDGSRCVVPQCSPASDPLTEELFRWPGFDADAFRRAMCSTSHATFVCWHRDSTPWGRSEHPRHMLGLLREAGRPSDRVLQLFACACVRQVWDHLTDERGRRAIEAAEHYADVPEEDRVLSLLEVMRIWDAAGAEWGVIHDPMRWATEYSDWAAAFASEPGRQEERRRSQAALLRDLFGDPFRQPPAVDPAWLTWNDGTLRKLAAAAYEHRFLPSGHLDPARLALFADALEDAGCRTDAEILTHLRGEGPHVRGCWAVDLLLGRD